MKNLNPLTFIFIELYVWYNGKHAVIEVFETGQYNLVVISKFKIMHKYFVIVNSKPILLFYNKHLGRTQVSKLRSVYLLL